MKYSIIDISSSSLSMIVAEIDGAKAEIVFKDRVPLFPFFRISTEKICPSTG